MSRKYYFEDDNAEKGMLFSFDLSKHDKQIRTEVISNICKQIEFEEKWLTKAYKDNGYKYLCVDVNMAFIGIKDYLKKLKEQK